MTWFQWLHQRYRYTALFSGLGMSLALLFMLIVLLRGTPPLYAGDTATNTPLLLLVDRTDDVATASLCTAAPNDCSLRGAIVRANANPSSTIWLEHGKTYRLIIPRAKGTNEDPMTGDLNILSTTVTITVASNAFCGAVNQLSCHATVEGWSGWDERILDIRNSEVWLQGITIRKGRVIDEGGSGIRNRGRLTLVDMDIQENELGYRGGGILNEGATASLTLTNTRIMSNNATTGGGIMNDGGVVVAHQLTLVRNSAVEGGGLFADGPTQIAESRIQNNVADWGGGLYLSATNFLLGDSQVMSNHATYDGAGLYLDVHGHATLIGEVLLQDNSASRFGGGINNYGTVVGESVQVIGNEAKDQGGGIYNYAALTLTHSLFADNRSSMGGGIGHEGTALMLDGSMIRGNYVGGGVGGGLWVVDSARPLTLTSVTFLSNTVEIGQGGGLGNASNVTLDQVTLMGNQATEGGAIYNDEKAKLTIRNQSLIQNNRATEKGGGLFNGMSDFMNGATATMVDSNIFSNTAISGAGVYNHATMTIRRSTLRGNQATIDGGAIFNESLDDFIIHESDFINNRAKRNGGALSNSGIVYLNTSFFSMNQAGNAGGAIYNFYEIFADRLLLRANRAKIGGAIGNINTLDLNRSLLIENLATQDGGAIFGAMVSVLMLTNSTITLNQADDNGGGIFIDYHEPVVYGFDENKLTNVTLTDNVADRDRDGIGDGGGLYGFDYQLYLANTIVADNVDMGQQAPDCAGLLVSFGYILIKQLTGCEIEGVTEGNLYGIDPRLAPMANDGGIGVGIHGEPLMARLPLSNSPVINAGAPISPDSTVPCLANDQRGLPRPIGDRCDIGAVESPYLEQTISATEPMIFLPLIRHDGK